MSRRRKNRCSIDDYGDYAWTAWARQVVDGMKKMTKAKHKATVKALRKQLDKMGVAFGLAAIRMAELEAHVTEDAAAIEHPKHVKKRKAK